MTPPRSFPLAPMSPLIVVLTAVVLAIPLVFAVAGLWGGNNSTLGRLRPTTQVGERSSEPVCSGILAAALGVMCLGVMSKFAFGELNIIPLIGRSFLTGRKRGRATSPRPG